MENSGDLARTIGGVFLEAPFMVGEMLDGLIALLFGTWWTVQLFAGFGYIFWIMFWWYVHVA